MAGDSKVLRATSAALIVLRRARSEAKVSPRTSFLKVSLEVPQVSKTTIEEVLADLSVALKAEGPLEFVFCETAEDGEAETRVVFFELGEAPAKRRKA